jgi:two-component system NtrC family sensor kinase
MGFITSNLSTLGKYTERLSRFIESQDRALKDTPHAGVEEIRKSLKIDHILGDIPKLLAESADGAERVRTIVQNLKSFSRVDRAERERANLNDCLESTLSIAWNELKYTCTVEKEYDPDLPPILCYPQQLNQVFLNILVNAAHSIEKSGTIRIRTWHDDGYVHVSISDTGRGIPEEIRHRIFEPFFTTKEPGKGTGLGLSISYDIVTRHGGTIDLESRAGEGTTFTIHFPRTTDAIPETAGREE